MTITYFAQTVVVSCKEERPERKYNLNTINIMAIFFQIFEVDHYISHLLICTHTNNFQGILERIYILSTSI